MADYEQATFGSWVFTEREPQFMRRGERGRWTKATCSRCRAVEQIGREQTAQDLLHRLDEHRCGTPAAPSGPVS